MAHALQFIRRVFDHAEANVPPCLIMFLDWEKAFDRVSHPAPLGSLMRFNIPDHFEQFIGSLYPHPQFSVEVEGHPLDKYEHKCGIRQGYPLSPYSSLTVTTALSYEVYHRPNLTINERLPNSTFNDVSFVHDAARFAAGPKELQAVLQNRKNRRGERPPA